MQSVSPTEDAFGEGNSFQGWWGDAAKVTSTSTFFFREKGSFETMSELHNFEQEEQCHCYDDEEEDLCVSERQNKACIASLSLAENPTRSSSSIFTHSGNNFVFGELVKKNNFFFFFFFFFFFLFSTFVKIDEDYPQKPPRKEVVQEVAVSEDAMLFGSVQQVPPANELPVVTKPPKPPASPVNATVSGPIASLAPIAAEFVNSFRSEGRGLPSSIQTLSSLMLQFPDLCYVVQDMLTNQFEVHFLRDRLIKALRRQESKFPNLVFTSFERGLKHAGMEVTQSTHGQVAVKKWRKKPGFLPAASKKNRKRNYNSDDDFVEGMKKMRPIEPSARKDKAGS
jgi:hypothetical protein